MPRERLHSIRMEQHTEAGSLLPDQVSPADQKVWDEQLPTVQAHWQEMSHVQLSVEIDKAHLKRMLAENDDDMSVIQFFTGTLERQEVNHAIKTLRRARNSAFGVDE